VERVRSGGVTLDECESDKVLAGEVEVRREGKVRWGARWTTVSRTDFEAVKWRFRKRVRSGEGHGE
jgi:hypothetical protein